MLIELERRDLPSRDLAVALASNGQPFVAAITVSEMLAGALLADSDARRDRRRSFLDRVLAASPTLAFGLEEARRYAEIYVELRRAGTPIGERDLMIAATALASGHSVMTRNVREFERVPGLAVLASPGSDG